jgi:phosphatidylglycerol:prolipoprotein diacylglycerol transferase
LINLKAGAVPVFSFHQMFPTLNDLLRYLFHARLAITIQTLGFFVALAFVAAYQVFRSEFKRYESLGKITAETKLVFAGRPSFITNLLLNLLLGFLLGYKVGGPFFQYDAFVSDPRRYIFSFQGSLIAGALVATLFALWVYLDQKGELNIKAARPENKIVHPYQLMGTIVVSVGVTGIIGAKLFDVIENLPALRYNPVNALLKTTGYNYYGGLIFGALTYLYIGYRHRMKLVHLADIGSPGMMLAYGVGRIGCQLAGDGDWGIINEHAKPGLLSWLPDWMWSFNYPHNAIEAGVYIQGCSGNHCNQLVQGVYPTPFYEVILCVSLFLFMWILRKQIIRPGWMFCFYLVLCGGERFFIEFIRVNPRYIVLGMPLTQAQIIAVLMLLGGIGGFVYLFFVRRKFVILNNR